MRRAVAVLVVALAAVLSTGPLAGAEDGKTPTLQTVDGTYDRGQTIEVEGEHWPSNTLLTVELCGNEAANGTVDCDARTSRTVATTKEGLLRAQLLATAPPSPCPCVVHVFQPQGILDFAVRVGINGVPSAPVSQDSGPKRSLEVTEARLTGGNGLAAWFGAGSERTLELTIENTGDTPIDTAAIRADLGRSSSPDQPIDVADLKPLAPGESVTITAPVELSALSVGSYVVAGRIAGFEGTDFEASTSTFPYGLVLLAVIVVVLIGWAISRRLGSDDEEDDAQPPAAPVAPESAASASSASTETDGKTEGDSEDTEGELVPG